MVLRRFLLLAALGVVLVILIVSNMTSNLSNGGWYGADGIWHRVGGPPR